MNEPSKVPDSVARIPVAIMKLAELRSLEKKVLRVLRSLDALKNRLPEVALEWDHQWHLWKRLRDAVQACELRQARSEAELWTVFVPKEFSIKETTRTEHFTITRHWHDSYGWMRGEKCKLAGEAHAQRMHPSEDPWREFARLNQPKEVAA